METLPYFGHAIHETDLKKALKELNPGFHFDMGANLNIFHPRIEHWQGVFLNGEHVSSMNRGLCPEFSVYKIVERRTIGGTIKERGECMFIGWRDTLERIVRDGKAGVTWETLCMKLGVDRKVFTGDPRELEVA